MMTFIWILPIVFSSTLGGQVLPMTDEFKNYIISEHNKLRVEQHASNMDEITWDPVLAQESEDWISSCKFEHQMKERGENLAFNTDEDPMKVMSTAFSNWYGEIKDYSYNHKSCAPASCHYTQLVWAHTNKVGCAIIKCPQLSTSMGSVPDAFYFGCFYSPRGNDISEYPFLRGESCSHCLKGQTCTLTGLCHGEGVKECKNKYENQADCKMWADMGECTSNKPFMSKKCAKSCKFCIAPPGEGDEEEEGPCEDENKEMHNGRPVCSVWNSFGECKNNPDYMNYACKKTCGVC